MKWVKYIGVLVKGIYKGTWEVGRQVVRTGGKFEIETVSCELKTQSPFYQVFICIGITLTPGTIVCKKVGNRVDVLMMRDGEGMPHRLFDEIFAP